jgi:beta-RFAP synthase
MNTVRVVTPARLHFGLLSWSGGTSRRFGGVGLMIDEPRLELAMAAADAWSAHGPLAERALEIARRVSAHLQALGTPAPPARITILQAPRQHVGLGSGTQLSLAVARGLAALAGPAGPGLDALAAWTGRGARSGIGLHGHAQGGLIVDGGRGPATAAAGCPPLLARLAFPLEWHVLVVIPPGPPGLSGAAERAAFAGLPHPDTTRLDRLCREVLLGLLPAVAERDLSGFGQALETIQDEVGQGFAAAQGGRIYASPAAERIVGTLRGSGQVHGVGQSSWGPALYGFSDAPANQREVLRAQVLETFELDPAACFWTRACNAGARVEHAPA